MEFERGTAEWQAEYDKEMTRLESTSGEPAPTIEVAPEQEATATEQTAAVETPAVVETEVEKALRLRLEAAERRQQESEKIAKGQQRYASRIARELENMQRAQAQAQHRQARPALLDQVDGLETAIQHVAKSPREQLPEEQPFGPNWVATVARALPDVDALLNDPTFNARAQEMRDQGDWTDPVNAIRDLSDLRLQHMTARAASAAAEQARKDFEAKHKTLLAQQVPSGRGGAAPKAPAAADDEVRKWETMPSDKFNEERARVMGGYSR